MQNLLRRIGALTLGLSLGLSLAHVPRAHAAADGAAHHAAQVAEHAGHDASDGGDCESCDQPELPCDASHAVGCASMGTCPVSMAECVGTAGDAILTGGAVRPRQVNEPPSTHRVPDTPPPRA